MKTAQKSTNVQQTHAKMKPPVLPLRKAIAASAAQDIQARIATKTSTNVQPRCGCATTVVHVSTRTVRLNVDVHKSGRDFTVITYLYHASHHRVKMVGLV